MLVVSLNSPEVELMHCFIIDVGRNGLHSASRESVCLLLITDVVLRTGLAKVQHLFPEKGFSYLRAGYDTSLLHA